MIKTLQRPDQPADNHPADDQPADDDQGEVQIMALDLPSSCRGGAALQTEAHLLPGIKVSFSGASDGFGKSSVFRLVSQVDYLGLVAAGFDNLFTAATGD